jgi:hypothetical protein
VWTPPLDPGQPAAPRGVALLAALSFVAALILPATNLSAPHTNVAIVLGTLGLLPSRIVLSPVVEAKQRVANRVSANLLRAILAFILPALAAHVSMPGSGWGEGYGASASAVVLLIAGGLGMTLALAPASFGGSRRGGAMPAGVVIALATAVALLGVGGWRYQNLPDADGYLASLPRRAAEVPAAAINRGSLLRGSEARTGESVRCEVALDASRGLLFATECAADVRRAVYPMRAGDPRWRAVPWTYAAHASALRVPGPYMVLALLGVALTVPMLLARRRFHARWACVEVFVDRDQSPDGTLAERPTPTGKPVAMRLVLAPTAQAYRHPARPSEAEIVPGTAAALRDRVAQAARWIDLTIVGRLVVSHTPLAVFLAHARR